MKRSSTSLFTPELGNRLIEMIPQQFRLSDVALKCGIRPGLLHEWLRLGAFSTLDHDAELRDFVVRFAEAEAAFQAEVLRISLEPQFKIRFDNIPICDLQKIMGDLPYSALSPFYNKFIHNIIRVGKLQSRRKNKSSMTTSIEFSPSKIYEHMLENRWKYTDKDKRLDEILETPGSGDFEDLLFAPPPAVKVILDRCGWMKRPIIEATGE